MHIAPSGIASPVPPALERRNHWWLRGISGCIESEVGPCLNIVTVDREGYYSGVDGS